MKIVIKHVDELKSTIHKGRVINEYLIYLKLSDGVTIECYNEFGEENKTMRINELLKNRFNISDTNKTNNDIIEEISFDEFKTNK